jgi:peptidoglycan/LPS O-acetylase OafA/YrhL
LRAENHVAVGYLRAFVTVLVVAHHAALAYHPFAPPPITPLAASPRWWPAFPVVDGARWGGFALLVSFNDVFFMSLMFFLSGLFVRGSLLRKGSGRFVRERALRLGVPFVVAAALLAPLAYYPSYLQRASHPHLGGFAREWLSLGEWPAGPAWFLWVLLAFGAAAGLLSKVAPRWAEALVRLAGGTLRRPLALFGLVLLASAVAYVPLTLMIGPLQWSVAGPFAVQTSRLLHYAVYFVAGIAVGAHGLDQGVLAADGGLARRFPLWVGGALLAFVLFVGVTLVAVSPGSSPAWATASAFASVLSCAASCFAFLAIFLRFANRPAAWRDSLRGNAYGIYLVHYPLVSWLQYALLPAPLPGVVKGAAVFAGALALSWAAAAALRRVPAVARVIP